MSPTPTSLLLLLCASLHWIAAIRPGVQAQGCAPRCGNLTISSPFGLVWGSGSEAKSCAHFGFEVNCTNGVARLGYNQWSEPGLQILGIFYSNNSLLVSDVHRIGDLDTSGEKGCRVPAVNTLIGDSFSISAVNKRLIFYNCTKTPANRTGLVETVCRNNTFMRVVGQYNQMDEIDRSYTWEGCSDHAVPVLGASSEANASDYEELARDGFLLLTWQTPIGPSIWIKGKKIILIALASAAATFLFTCLYVLIWHRKGKRLRFLLCKKTNNNTEKNYKAMIVSYGPLAPKRYMYSEVTKITSSRNNHLGKGGYGVVFKGRLHDGRLVAVKFLHDCKGNGDEFVNEVMTIGRTSHVNVVRLFGFCLEGSKRALIYEYMPNGSLDNYIYSENPKEILGWERLYAIAIGIARGLEYLHHSCNTRIVHFDIKPQNILLDKDFSPKIADFGLAKLCRTKESKLSMIGARGTIGFIAPEVHSRTFGVVSTKSDVYSYGMMLLEMVGGRRNVKSIVAKSSEKYFPDWIYDHFAQDDGLQACEVTGEIEEIARNDLNWLVVHTSTTHVSPYYNKSSRNV